MAAMLAPLLYAWDFDLSGEGQYLKPYQAAWDQELKSTGSSLPDFETLAGHLKSTTNPTNDVFQALCPNLQKVTWDTPVCSIQTCSGAACSLAARAMTIPVPADIIPQNFDTSGVVGATSFTEMNTFAAGATSWWVQMKNRDWWQGSNHGVDSLTNEELASSAIVDFTQNPGQTVITGAGPVWGCTAVAVVSQRGAYTTHFWESFFSDQSMVDGTHSTKRCSVSWTLEIPSRDILTCPF
ncbi:hypothetical protein F5884DRAFT_757851 [Xylogone sp. PMI_703]|nr:hypothetical protein F5884DRAFT_757851 [Xylogone sp. PMI_703]